MKVCPSISWRAPMFQFVFEAALFRFQFQGPSLEPLFRLPPTCAARVSPSPRRLSAQYSGGWLPPGPRLRRDFKKARAEVPERVRGRSAQRPVPRPNIRTTAQVTAHNRSAISCILIVVVAEVTAGTTTNCRWQTGQARHRINQRCDHVAVCRRERR